MLYKEGSEQLRLVFDGHLSTHINWFTKSRLVFSPYTDIKSSRQNYFSIEGHQPTGRNDRSFFISKHYGGCSVDTGWLVLIGQNGCPWENPEKNSHIAIKYSKGSTAVNWTNGGAKLGHADVMAIYLR
eukprot:m.27853 g.27853  ORF g.27853 m.27853 type:complete len:128 (+) comp30405_c0_seq2:525-908(+)